MKKLILSLLAVLIGSISLWSQDTAIQPIEIWVNSNLCDSAYVIRNVIKHSYVSCEEFEQIESDPYLHLDTLKSKVSVKESLFEIHHSNSTISTFEDFEDEEHEFSASHSYLGQFISNYFYRPHLVYSIYAEHYMYRLVDNIDDKQDTYYYQPVISPNAEYVAAYGSEPFEVGSSHLDIYKINEEGLQRIITISYPLQGRHESVSWGKDGNLYIPIFSDEEYLSSYELLKYMKVNFSNIRLLPDR